MKDEQQEKLFRAIGEVGGDLVDMAEKRTFAPSAWRKWGTLAACLAVVLSLSALVLPYFPIGCGSGMANESAAPTDMKPEAAADDAAMEPSTQEAPAETPEDMPEDTGMLTTAPETLSPTEDEMQDYQGLLRSRIVFRYTYYYVLPELRVPLGEPPASLGEALETVEDAEAASLIGCQVYRYENATEFDNHSVNGLTVPQKIWIETDAGYVYATTLNEKTVARFTISDVMLAEMEGDDQWLLRTFVDPVYNMDSFASAAELTSDQLNQMLLLTRGMNAGMMPDGLWSEEVEGARFFVVPVTEASWRLSRILEGYTYTPEETGAYDAQMGALVFDPMLLSAESPFPVLELDRVEIVEDRIVKLTVNYYFDKETEGEPYLVRTFTIRFDEDAWRYLSILDDSRDQEGFQSDNVG